MKICHCGCVCNILKMKRTSSIYDYYCEFEFNNLDDSKIISKLRGYVRSIDIWDLLAIIWLIISEKLDKVLCAYFCFVIYLSDLHYPTANCSTEQ